MISISARLLARFSQSDLRLALGKDHDASLGNLREKFAGEVLRVEQEAEEQRQKWLEKFSKLQEK